MAKSALDRLKDATAGAFGLGRTVANQVVRTAAPRVADTVGVVRSHLPRHRPAGTPPTPAARAPQAPPRTATADTVTPADVARNISKHPPTRPATKPAARKPAKKAVPGAKLPARKASTPDQP